MGSDNKYIRNKAQQIIVDRHYTQLIPGLKENLKKGSQPLTVTQSLWTLEGLGSLTLADVLPLLKSYSVHALTALPAVMNKTNIAEILPVLKAMIQNRDTVAAPYIGFILPFVKRYNSTATEPMLIDLLRHYPNYVYVIDAVISNLYNSEKSFFKKVGASNDTASLIYKRFHLVFENMARSSSQKQFKALVKKYPAGAAMFQSVCQPCHGADGNGIRALGPPLNNSNWVNGDKNKLMAIVLFGLTGPVKVGDKIYKAPEIAGEMPAIGQSKEFTSEDIAQVLSFIRAAWSNKSGPVKAAEVDMVKKRFAGRDKLFTPRELEAIK